MVAGRRADVSVIWIVGASPVVSNLVCCRVTKGYLEFLNVTILIEIKIVAKRKACLQPEKTQGYQYLFAVQFFNSYVYRGRLVAGLDKVFENRDRHHRIRRQILRQNEGLIWFLVPQS